MARTHFGVIGLAWLGALSVAGCTDAPAESAGAGEASDSALTGTRAPPPFCASGAAASTRPPLPDALAQTSFWGPSEVQDGIRRVLRSDRFGCTPHSAYLVAYAAMTSARDAARCEDGNAMKPPTELDARLNDALADMMTRSYLGVVEACRGGASLSNGADVDGAFCAMHARAERENWTALRVALGSTAYYLSTHLAVAVSALPHVDDLWVGTPFASLEARIGRLAGLKPTYDAFNAFLGSSFTIVTDSLERAGLTPSTCRADLFGGVCRLAGRVTGSASLFGNRRDVAFRSGLAIAKLTARGEHPWTVRGADGATHMRVDVRRAPAFGGSEAMAAELAAIADEGRRFEAALANPLMQTFGGHSFRSLADAESKRACEQSLSVY